MTSSCSTTGCPGSTPHPFPDAGGAGAVPRSPAPRSPGVPLPWRRPPSPLPSPPLPSPPPSPCRPPPTTPRTLRRRATWPSSSPAPSPASPGTPTGRSSRRRSSGRCSARTPTFDEADEGFRAFGELLRHLENRGVVALREGSARGDPEVAFPEGDADEDAFALLVGTVGELARGGGAPQLSGLKDKLRKREPDFSEKRHGFRTFLSFAKAARARELVTMRWDDDLDDYVLDVPAAASSV